MSGAPLFLLSLYLLSAPSLQRPSEEGGLAEKSRLGKELMAAGRYSEAVPVYRELVEALPSNPGLLVNLGMALHLAGQDEEAVPRFEAALRLQPDSLPASLFLGAANVRLGRAAAAVPPLQKAVRLQPDNRDARSMLAEALLTLERYAQAESHLRRLAQMTPTDPAAWFNLGNAYEELAGQAFTDLLKRHPESAYALALLADARMNQNQRNAAFHLYRQAIERGPALRGLHAAIAAIYRGASHPDWALIEEERERRLPRPQCPRETLECSFAAGKYREVVAAASRSKTPAAFYWRVRAHKELAVQAFTRLTALPTSAESHERMAQVQRDERHYAESAAHWRKAIALAPADPRLRTELAITLRLNQEFADAERVLEELVRSQPDAPEANYLLGDVLLAQQQPERAIPFLEKAVRLGPSQPHAHGALGRAYALAGNAAGAIPHLKQALSADEDGSLRLQLARAYQATGQSEQARVALADYEEFRKARQAESEAPPITPP